MTLVLFCTASSTLKVSGFGFRHQDLGFHRDVSLDDSCVDSLIQQGAHSLSLSRTHSLSLSHTHTRSRSLSLALTNTHPFPLSHTHSLTHTPSLSHTLSPDLSHRDVSLDDACVVALVEQGVAHGSCRAVLRER